MSDAEDDFSWEEKAEEREEDEAEKEARIARRTAAIVLRSLRRQASVTRRAADVGQEDTPEDLPEVDENEQPTGIMLLQLFDDKALVRFMQFNDRFQNKPPNRN